MAKKKKILDAYGRPMEPTLAEIASSNRTDPYKYWLGNLKENPDPILKHKAGGKGIAFFEDMLVTDANLYSLIQTRILGVLDQPREIVAASDEPADQEARDFVRDALDELENFDQDLEELCDAIPKGFAVSEIMWKRRDDGKIVIDRLLSRDQKAFAFDKATNDLVVKTASSPYSGEPVPPRKFLVFSFRPKHENPYGSGVCRYCYWPHFFKKHSIKWWSVLNEKFGQPTVIGKYQRGRTAEEQTELQKAIEAIKVETGIVIPDDVAIEIVEAKMSGQMSTHEKFLQFLDGWEAKAVLGATLTSDAGKFGTQALGQVHEGIRSIYAKSDAKALDGVINHQLVRWLVDWNFAVEKYPRQVSDTSPPEDLKQSAETYKVVVDMGLPIGLAHVYEKFGIPEPEEGEELLKKPKAPNPFEGLGAANNQREEEDSGSDGPRRPQDDETPDDVDAKPFTDTGAFVQFAAVGSVLPDDLTPDQRRRARRALHSPEEITRRAALLGRSVYQDWIDQAVAYLVKGLEPGDVITPEIAEKAENLADVIDVAPLGNLIEAAMIYGRLRGGYDVLLDAQLADDPVRFAEWPAEFKQAIAFIKKKHPKTRKEYDRLTAKSKANSFTVKLPWVSARKGRRSIIAEIQDLVESALRDGLTVDDFQDFVEEKLERAGVTPLSDWHIETVFRTNVEDAYHAGRWQMLNDPDVADMVVAYRYVTMDDNRVRPAHEDMHGRTFAKDDPIWLEWWPPNGYNCRCTTISIFTGEEWEGSTKPADLTPDEGFAHNSAYLQKEAA